MTAASAAADQKIADAEYEKAVTEAEELLKDENLSAAGKEALQKAIEEAKAVGRPAFWSA